MSLNQSFLEEHSCASRTMSLHVDHVIIYKGNELSLWRNIANSFEPVEKNFLARDLRYVRLKQVSHLPGMIYALLEQMVFGDETSISRVRRRLSFESTRISRILSLLVAMHSDDISHQKLVLMASQDLIHTVLARHDIWQKQDLDLIVGQYRETIQPSLAYNNDVATHLQLLALEVNLAKWVSHHGVLVERSRAIVVCPHGPKDGHIETQYLMKWYQKAIGSSDVLNEWVYQKEESPDKIATMDCKMDLIEKFLYSVEFNKIIGEKLLGNRQAMFSDVLKQSGESWIKKRV